MRHSAAERTGRRYGEAEFDHALSDHQVGERYAPDTGLTPRRRALTCGLELHSDIFMRSGDQRCAVPESAVGLGLKRRASA